MRAIAARILVCLLLAIPPAAAASPEHYRIGAYLTAIHHIDIAAGTFDADFWLWSVGSSPTRNPLDTMEFIGSESLNRRLASAGQRGPVFWRQEKIVGSFRQDWDLRDFPFDRQVLRIPLEEGVDEANALVYDADVANSGFLTQASPQGWRIRALTVRADVMHYPTNFGDPATSGGSDYAHLLLEITVQRTGLATYLNLTAPLYAAFLLCVVTFLMHKEGRAMVESRIALLAGALFAIVLNMRSVSTMLGSAHQLTVIDRLHIVVLAEIAVATVATIWASIAHDRGRQVNRRLDYVCCGLLVISFIIINALLVAGALTPGSA